MTNEIMLDRSVALYKRSDFQMITVKGNFTTEELKHFCETGLFKDWITKVSPEIKISGIEVTSVVTKPNGMGQPIFATLMVDATDASHRKLPGFVFLRGGSVAILPILKAEEHDEMYVIFTEQHRLAIGDDASVEIPAGMLDGSGDFIGIAGKEFEEEIGIPLKENDLLPLSPVITRKNGEPYSNGLAVSSGGSDEAMRYFLFERKLPLAKIKALEGKLTGNAEEHEVIKLRIVPLVKAYSVTRDSKFFAAYGLAVLNRFL